MVSRIVTFGVLLLLFGPIVLVIWMSFTPAPGFSLDFTDPSLRWYRELFKTRHFIESFQQSVVLGLAVTVISLCLGTLAAYAIGRYRFRGRDAISTLLLSPLMIPGVAIGIALAQFMPLIGLKYGYTTLLLGHVIITVPYVTRTVGASMIGIDPNLELAAFNLGASWFRTFWQITVPLLKPGLLAGALFTFITSFDELTVSLFLSGVRIVPLPVRIYTYLQTVLEPTVAAVSALLVLLSVLAILLVEWLVGLDRILGAPRGQRV